MPPVYAAERSASGESYNTAFLAVTGPETAWPVPRGVSDEFIKQGDGTDTTLLLIESAESGICWMKSENPPLEKLGFSTEDGRLPSSIGGSETHGACAAMASGRTVFLPDTTTSTALRSLATVHGGEQVSAH
jgi:hypothetical protein